MTFFRTTALVGTLAGSLVLPSGGTAQQGALTCADHAAVVDRLADRYGETRQSIALGANNTVIETFASAETGTWTLTVTTPGGPTCLVAAGEAWQRMDDPLPNTDPGA